ncbi:hypothetical protein XSR1_220013 [Xenorhabdus szentirmaii DSM 16338]|uniref:Uncharacterized protein n=1 Tax=Xenorhabdus szentirmaii DSM 16338 TaxID=1427518 RepID=W1IYC0_9GAMM|nr:hypothetical protein XSR1_220013 [Xenorhabdus szentirmaii DSM 16338]
MTENHTAIISRSQHKEKKSKTSINLGLIQKSAEYAEYPVITENYLKKHTP